ncbi:hypothetical protein AZ66_22990 [Paenibacillus sp. E194]|uniref:DUF4097 domain-containing protein n=1 Tax=Paenibacillus alvei TaxID=44250 RepID=A0ABT4E7P3_PAEAL|nr:MULTISPECIES: DUF4097 family beta strand repeat-containing protein [Paenibacillus]KJB85737.1 hypothetical protein AZ66_22990 [Paenibacillus sp. E194]MCY9529756.1 DUF4097 domain-containing protein [Paenibacillus alvei]SDG13355.1 hypothetical protein SAMN04488689_11025 [Paenibacillus sp. cl6col]
MNNNKKLAMILLAAASIGLAGCTKESSAISTPSSSQQNSSISTNTNVNSETSDIRNVSNTVKGDISQIDVNNIHSLKIQSNAAIITVIGDKQINQAELEVSKGNSQGMDTNVTTSIQDGTLQILLKNKLKIINTEPLPSLTIRLPYKEFKSLEIDNEVGNISVESELSVQHLNVSSGTGDVTVTDVIGMESSNISTDVGSVEFALPDQPAPLYVNLSTKIGTIDNQVALEKETNTTKIVAEELHGYVGKAQSESATLNIFTQVGEITFKN